MKDKIRKLLILANDPGATDAEKDTALAMAQTLMMKYNLEVSLDSDEAKVKHGDLFGAEYKRSYHREILAPAVAEMYTCVVVRYNPGYKFVGRPESIDACEQTFTSIVEQIEELWKKHKKELRVQDRIEDLSNEYRSSFKYAAATVVWNRIREIIAKTKSSDVEAVKATGCTALVVTDSIKQQIDDIRSYMKLNMNTRRGRAVSRSNNRSGSGAGRVAGEQVSIQQKMSQERKRLT